MKRVKQGGWWRLLALFVLVAMAGTLFVLRTRVASQGVVILPPNSYSSPLWREKATKYQANLARLQAVIPPEYTAQQFRFLTLGESSVGGIGFWSSPNPAEQGSQKKYLGVFARAQIIPAYLRSYGDSQPGRLTSIMDAYVFTIIGKEVGDNQFHALAAELKKMPDPEIAGGAIILIYSKEPVTSPTFEQTAEAYFLFMPREAVIKRSELRMTNDNLLKESFARLVVGADSIRILRENFFSP